MDDSNNESDDENFDHKELFQNHIQKENICCEYCNNGYKNGLKKNITFL